MPAGEPDGGHEDRAERAEKGTGVIPEIDEALFNLLRTGAVPDKGVEVAFEAPTRDWAARRNGPAVNAYLYDIREDVGRRATDAQVVRDAAGIPVGRRRPLRSFRLSYLVTSWTKRAQDEHRLLAAVLGCLLGTDVLPLAGTGTLARLGAAIPLSVAVPPQESRSLADIWSALGGDLKPSLDVVIVAPFPNQVLEPVGPAVTESYGVIAHRLDEPGVADPIRVRRVVR
jgi:Pvc16 N-terminal domain